MRRLPLLGPTLACGCCCRLKGAAAVAAQASPAARFALFWGLEWDRSSALRAARLRLRVRWAAQSCLS
jgi:hypothetical protein